LIGFLFEEPETDEKAWKKVMKDGARPLLTDALEALRDAESFEPGDLETSLGRILAEHDVKPGKLYQPIRVAITGTSVSPGIFESLAALGREDSLARIDAAVSRLRS
jgi:glutamyl/glutaminyl-tRNA synthetase